MFYLFIVIAYLLGSISPSIIQGRLAGIDIKKEGSGNAGTTNTLRTLGKKAALITLIVDIGKGVLAVFLGSLSGQSCAYICAVAVFLGHIFPLYYGFKGGKGVATAFGACLMVDWRVALLALAVAAVLTAVSRRMSVGSILAAVSLPLFSLVFQRGFWPYAAVIALIIIVKHHSNIGRLLKGTEPPLNFKK